MMEVFEGTTIEKDLAGVENDLQEAIQSGNPDLSRMSGHIIFSGGKRIRPALGLTVYRALGGIHPQQLNPISVALELIHTATLIHDDIIDRSSQRRGAPSVHSMFGVGKALVTGDFLFARAFGMCSLYGAEIIGIAANACTGLAEGEILQMNTSLKDITIKKYMTIIKKKTADLFAAGTKIAAILANTSNPRIEAMEVFGQHMGLTFQIIDDLLDISGTTAMGKPRGTDIKEGKPTLAIIRARDQLNTKDRKTLLAIFDKKRRTANDIKKVIKLVRSTDGLEHADRKARRVLKAALKETEHLDDSMYKDLLVSMAQYIVERDI